MPRTSNSPQTMTERENEIFDSLENLSGDNTFKDVLYRDGVPQPEVYGEQPVRVVFVFKEPNLSGNPRAVDMRAEVRDSEFRQSRWKPWQARFDPRVVEQQGGRSRTRCSTRVGRCPSVDR